MAIDLTMGGQFALIPAKVLYDDSIPATAKLLYGEIYRLSHANGYCYASNQDFTKLLDRSASTVGELLKTLAGRGYIRIKMVRRYGSAGDIIQRRIFCGQTLDPVDPEEPECIPKNRETSPEKSGDGLPKNREDTTKRKNKKNTPIVPVEVCNAIHDYIGDDPEYRAAFDGFLANRRAMKKPVMTTRAINAIINRLRKAGSRETEIAMLDKAVEHNWVTVYPLKADELPRAQAGSLEEQEGVTYF